MPEQSKRRGRPPGSKSGPNKPGAGRPKGTAKPDSKALQIYARVSADEKQLLEGHAASEGLALSAWVRQRCGLSPIKTGLLDAAGNDIRHGDVMQQGPDGKWRVV